MSQYAAVLGSPISHSRSPLLYRAGFAALGMKDWEFSAIDCDAAALPELVSGLSDQWAGLAVTMPGKAAAASVAATTSSQVKTLGVANTLVRRPGGWHAENTDIAGVAGSLQAAGVLPTGRVLILGGGGTARAVIAGLAQLRWDGPLIVAGRRPDSTAAALDIAGAVGLHATAISFTDDELRQTAATTSLLVSTVPAGAPDQFANTLAAIPALFDVVYHPWPTALAAAGTAGRTIITGLDMLLHQALVQFELVTGRPAPAAAMRQALQHAVGGNLPLPLAPTDR